MPKAQSLDWDLSETVRKHARYLASQAGGERMDLRYKIMRGISLTGMDLRSGLFAGADLRGAGFAGANLSDASLTSANLDQADMSGARLNRADLRGARLVQARLDRTVARHAHLEPIPVLSPRTLEVQREWVTDLTGALLTDADLRYIDLTGARLREADFEHCDLTRARLERTDRTGCRFTDCTGLTPTDSAPEAA